MEEEIHRLERRLAQLERDLQAASHAQDLEKIQQCSQAYAETQAALEQSMETWTELAAVELTG
jgi:hypothetical protein